MQRKIPPPEERWSLTPLIDIAFLIIIFFMALPMRHLDAKLAAYLPTNDGIRLWDQKPREKVDIRLLKRGDELVYRLGQNDARSPRGLEPVLRALGGEHTYEVYASADVPLKAVVAMVNQLAKLDYGNFQFRGTALPSLEVRRAIPLPRTFED